MEERKQRIFSDGAKAIAERDAFVDQLCDELPEARLIKRIIDTGTSRIITFELLSEEPAR